MTDLAPGYAATRSCPSCGAQNAITSATCEKCGAALPDHLDGDAQRDDLEVVEVARAVGSVGYDAEFRVDGDSLQCPKCGQSFDVSDASIASGQAASDTTRAAPTTR